MSPAFCLSTIDLNLGLLKYPNPDKLSNASVINALPCGDDSNAANLASRVPSVTGEVMSLNDCPKTSKVRCALLASGPPDSACVRSSANLSCT